MSDDAQAAPSTTPSAQRAQWIVWADRLARPVLEALASGRLRTTIPNEQSASGELDRSAHSPLEAFARLMAGVGPWLASKCPSPQRTELAPLAQEALHRGTDPRSPDFLNFTVGQQPLVDTAFLCHAILRSPALLWDPLSPATRRNVVAAVSSTRAIAVPINNWLLFAAAVEAFLAFAGETWDAMRVDYAIRQHDQWYKGDGVYGDGPQFHWDYYNSYVIQPMLLDVLAEVGRHSKQWDGIRPRIQARGRRYAAVLERMIAPDGTFPAIGRSITYRAGAFQMLAQLAAAETLPTDLTPGGARRALGLVLRRTLDASGTFDPQGWLRIGLAGHQPQLAERYISPGSLYLTSTALLPLKLSTRSAFWSDPDSPTTGERLWGGQDKAPDKAYSDA